MVAKRSQRTKRSNAQQRRTWWVMGGGFIAAAALIVSLTFAFSGIYSPLSTAIPGTIRGLELETYQ